MPISSKSGKQKPVSAVKIVKFFRLGGRFYDPPVWQIALPNMKNIIKII